MPSSWAVAQKSAGPRPRYDLRILGIDYGRRRIGIAVSDETELLARGIETLDRDKIQDPLARIRDLAAELEAGKIVVGMPHRHGGEPAELTAEIEAFAAALRTRLGLEVLLVDESYSSESAHVALHMRGIKRKKHKGHVDRMAACLILQSYLDSKRT